MDDHNDQIAARVAYDVALAAVAVLASTEHLTRKFQSLGRDWSFRAQWVGAAGGQLRTSRVCSPSVWRLRALSEARLRPYRVSFRQSLLARASLSKICGATSRFFSDSPSFMRKKPLVV